MASSTTLPSTVVDYVSRSQSRTSAVDASIDQRKRSKLSLFNGVVSSSKEAFVRAVNPGPSEFTEQASSANPEFKLPSYKSLFIMIGGNAIFQVSFFIIVSSASLYAEKLGGSATFSGLVIGVPTVFSGITLIFVTRIDKGQYAKPQYIAYSAMILGSVLYALAYKTRWLYMILIGRIVTGVGFIAFMYSKRYCSDSRIVGIRRRTTLASLLVIGQGFGLSAGPFFGGLLYKIGFSNPIFNGVTSPGWVMAVVWILFLVLSLAIFEDVPPRRVEPQPQAIEMSPADGTALAVSQSPVLVESFHLSRQQWGVVVCMCYFSMLCFHILGGWEANIPVFTASVLGYTPYNAGNFLALGGITSFPFLLANVWYARRIQDRVILATGTSLGLAGLLIMLSILLTDKVTFGSFFVCWVLVALGFNLASTCTLSLLSKQLPDTWNTRISLAIQYSNYTGRVTGAILGGAGVKIGMRNYVGIQIALVGIGAVMYMTLWRSLKAKTG